MIRCTLITFLIVSLSAGLLHAQVPDRMSFQAVVRDASGKLVAERTVSLRISIRKGSPQGGVVFSEDHRVMSNENGLVSLEIGGGRPLSGQFGGIDWSSGPFFMQTEVDPGGGNSYSVTGTSRMLSVPYALYAKTAENAGQEVRIEGAGATTVSGSYPNFVISSTDENTTYRAGAGIRLNGTTIINDAPDQRVSLTGAGTTTVSGSYPNFTITSTGGTINYSAGAGIDISGLVISNTSPDRIVTLQGAGSTTVTGTYPNFTIESIDQNTTYEAGAGIRIDGTTIVNTEPDVPLVIRGGAGIEVEGSYPNYTISAEGSTTHYVGERFGGGLVFYVYDGGQHGLIASLDDLGETFWSNSINNTGAASHYDGMDNTDRIVASQGAGGYAARVCRDYRGGGFSDWYLPSAWELNLLHQNAFMLSFKLDTDGDPMTSPLTAMDSYWSSTQFDSQLAYMVYFADGTMYLATKGESYRIRAVRRF